MEKKITSEELTYQLLCTIRQFNIFDDEAHYFGGEQPLYTSEIHVLSCIGDNVGFCASDIARTLGVTRGAISQMLKKLEKKGYLTREADPDNKLRFILGLSAKGVKAYEKHLEYHSYLESMIRELTSDAKGGEREIICCFLARLEKRLLPESGEDGVKSGLLPGREEMRQKRTGREPEQQ